MAAAGRGPTWKWPRHRPNAAGEGHPARHVLAHRHHHASRRLICGVAIVGLRQLGVTETTAMPVGTSPAHHHAAEVVAADEADPSVAPAHRGGTSVAAEASRLTEHTRRSSLRTASKATCRIFIMYMCHHAKVYSQNPSLRHQAIISCCESPGPCGPPAPRLCPRGARCPHRCCPKLGDARRGSRSTG